MQWNWPERLRNVRAEASVVARLNWLALYALLLAVAGITWLVAATELHVLRAHGLTLLLLLGLRYTWEWVDFSPVSLPEPARARGSLGRVVTWSAALLFGPSALWLDVVAMGVDYAASPRRWRDAGHFLLRLGRELMPALAALALYQRWGGSLLLTGFTPEALWLALYATAVKVGLFWLLMAPVLFFNGASRRWPPLAWLMQTLGFMANLFLFYTVPEPFAIAAAAVYAQSGLGIYMAVMIGLLLLGLLAHQLNRSAAASQQRARQSAGLETLAQAILRQPPDESDLPQLLAIHAPALFEDAWLEIRLLPDRVLYFQGREWTPAADELWQQVAGTTAFELRTPAINPAMAQGYASQAWLVPIVAVASDPRFGGEVIGGIYLIPADERQEDEWLAVAQSLAALIALAIQREDTFHEALAAQAEAYEEEVYAQAYQAEVYAQALAYQRMSQELALAGKIQASFLPQQLPELDGWQLAVTLEPAMETSGDFYDFIPLPDGRLGILVADVSDKGMGAALYMALSRTLIRIYAVEHDVEPEKALATANHRILADTNSDLFVTVFYAVLDPQTGTLIYCNAGHNPPFLLPAANSAPVQTLPLTALPLGLFDDLEWERATVQLRPGDVLLLYTDGVTEAEDEVEDYFGEARLQAVARANVGRPAEVIENRIITAVYDFMGEASPQDDMTLMVVVRNPG